jgi:hypothetical protein
MELIGRYAALGFTVEAYFPEPDAPDTVNIWVVRDGKVVEESTTRLAVDSVYGMDQDAMDRIEAAAEAAVRRVARRETSSEHMEEFAQAA